METTVRPLPEPPGAAPVAHGPVGPSLRRVVIAVVVLLALVVAGFAIGRRALHDDHATRVDFRHVVAGLGSGWTAVAAKDEGVDTGPPFPGAYTILLGTHDDPTAPAMELAWRVDDGAPTFDNLAASSGMEPLDTAGRRTACAVQRDTTVLCYAEEDGRGLQLRANRVGLDEIRVVVDAVTFADGRPVLDTAALPADLDVLVDGKNAGLGLVANGNADHPSVASVLYTGPGRSTALLVVGDATRQELAYGGVFMQWERSPDGSPDRYVSTSGEGTYVLWFDDEHGFWLRLSAEDVPAALAAADSVRPATADEWAAIPDRPPWDGPPIIP